MHAARRVDFCVDTHTLTKRTNATPPPSLPPPRPPSSPIVAALWADAGDGRAGGDEDGRHGASLVQQVPAAVAGFSLQIPVVGFIARGTQRLNCSLRGPWSGA